MTDNKSDQPAPNGLVTEQNSTCQGLGHLEPFWSHVARCAECTARLTPLTAVTNAEQAWRDLLEEVEIEDTLLRWAGDEA